MSLAKSAEVPASNTKFGCFTKLVQDHKNKQHKIREEIKAKAEILASEVVNEYLERKPYRSSIGFAKFPTAELTHVRFHLTLHLI